MSLPPNWSDCYFIVHATPDQVWSTARRSYVPADDEAYLSWRKSFGRYPPAVFTHEELTEQLEAIYPSGAPITEAAFQRAIDAHIENTAKARQYSSAVACASYATSTIPAWKAEAEAFVAWRDSVWAYVFTELGKVQADERQPPLPEAFIAELPSMEWPT